MGSFFTLVCTLIIIFLLYRIDKKISKQNKQLASALNKLQSNMDDYIDLTDTKIWPED